MFLSIFFFFSSRRRHTRSVSAFLLNRSSDLHFVHIPGLSYSGIQSATSRQNTKDQVYAQNEMLAYQQKESTRSEERRVGKEWKSRLWGNSEKRKKKKT